MSFYAFEAEERKRVTATIERHKAIMDLAIDEGTEVETVELQDLPGLWWRVPEEWQHLTCCEMARVE